jgi:5-methyltetrahydrofolate--homocysteine methyltransferase
LYLQVRRQRRARKRLFLELAAGDDADDSWEDGCASYGTDQRGKHLGEGGEVKDLLDRLTAGETLCGDGAWGTQLMARGLRPGDSPEALNLSRPEVLAEVAGFYVEAGAQLITTNTFGGSSLNLETHGLADRTEEINHAAVEAIREVTNDRALISGSVGPTGKILTPYGDTEPAAVSAAFDRQIGALLDAGADLICIETMMDPEEARLAVAAARKRSPTIPVIATMTFNATPRGFFTTMGTTVEQACRVLVDAGADLVGSNCGNGIDAMVELARDFAGHATVPVVIQSNAGLPENLGDELVYPETPDYMAARVDQLMELGVAIIGGCCGTGPDHIRAFRHAIDRQRAKA